jgi:hypothetical protein
VLAGAGVLAPFCAAAGNKNAAKAALNKLILVWFVIVYQSLLFSSIWSLIFIDSAACRIKNPDFRR